jgi:type I restriction enzyme S subunit
VSNVFALIAELCPQGVEFKKLGEVVSNLDSQRRPVTRSARKAGEYPYYGANGVQDFVDAYLFDGTFLLLGEDGSVVNRDGSPVLTE